MSTLTLRPPFRFGLFPKKQHQESPSAPAYLRRPAPMVNALTILGLFALGAVSVAAPLFGNPAPKLLALEGIRPDAQGSATGAAEVHSGGASDDAWAPIPSLMMPVIDSENWTRISGELAEGRGDRPEVGPDGDSDPAIVMPPLKVVASPSMPKGS